MSQEIEKIEYIEDQPLPLKTYIVPKDIDSGNFTSKLNILTNYLQSANFATGSTGWRLDAEGNIEANSGTFRGSLVANSIDIPDTTTANSFHVNNTGNVWWGATAIGSAVAKVLNTGVATFTDIVATGTVNATGGFIGSADTALPIEAGGFNVGVTGYLRGGQTAYNTGTGFFLGYDTNAYKFSIGVPTGDRLLWTGSALSVVGKIKLTGMSGTAGETLSAGKAVYLKQSDGQLWLTNAATNTEAIYKYVGIVIADAAAAASANLYTEGIIDGFSFTFTGTPASTADWQQATTGGKTWILGVATTGDYYKQTFSTGDYVSNIEKVEIYFAANTGSPTGDVKVEIFETDTDGYDTGTAIGTKTVTNPSASSWVSFAFATAIVVKPRTQYCLKISTTVNDSSNHWNLGGAAAAKNGGMFRQQGSGVQGWYLNLGLALKTYHTAQRFMSVGDNVYLTDTAGTINYIPGTYQMAVGTVLSTTEIVIPYVSERLIEKRGFKPGPGSTAGQNSGGTGAVSIPKNARKVICNYNINEGTKGDSLILINSLKTSSDNGVVSYGWSGNYITFSFSATNNKISDLKFTFLT